MKFRKGIERPPFQVGVQSGTIHGVALQQTGEGVFSQPLQGALLILEIKFNKGGGSFRFPFGAPRILGNALTASGNHHGASHIGIGRTIAQCLVDIDPHHVPTVGRKRKGIHKLVILLVIGQFDSSLTVEENLLQGQVLRVEFGIHRARGARYEDIAIVKHSRIHDRCEKAGHWDSMMFQGPVAPMFHPGILRRSTPNRTPATQHTCHIAVASSQSLIGYIRTR